MTDLPALITAGTLALTSVGGGFVWVVTYVQGRFERIEKELRQCKRRELRQITTNSKQLIVIEMLWRECERLGDEASRAVLKRSEKLLDDLKREARKEKDEEDDSDE